MILLLLNLFLTFVTTLLTSIRLKLKCGTCGELMIKPSTAPPTPPDEKTRLSAPSSKTLDGGGGNDPASVSVRIPSDSPQNTSNPL